MKKVYIQPITDSMDLEEELVIATSIAIANETEGYAVENNDCAKQINFADDIDW